MHIDLSFAAANGTSSGAADWRGAKVQVRRLAMGHADDLAGLTWAGQSYEESSDASPTGQEVAGIAFLGLCLTTFAFVAWYTGMARIGVERAGLFAGLVPVASLLGAAAVGTGTVTLGKVAGAALVAGALVMGLTTARGERGARSRRAARGS